MWIVNQKVLIEPHDVEAWVVRRVAALVDFDHEVIREVIAAYETVIAEDEANMALADREQ